MFNIIKWCLKKKSQMKTLFSFCAILTASILLSQGFCFFEASGKNYRYKEWTFLYEEKCSKCHTLERVFKDVKTEDEWKACVTEMMRKSPLWITPEDASQIADEIIGIKEELVVEKSQKRKYDNATVLFIDRCTRCHSANMILTKNKTREEWRDTVWRMRDKAPDTFFRGDISAILDFIVERSELMKDDISADIMVNKCLICHESGRILLEQKTRKEWEECVRDMRDIVRDKLKKDWYTHDEFKLIVNLLVKTQGVE